MADTSKSKSIEQQETEVYLSMEVEKWIGCALEKNAKVYLAKGVHIEPDLYSEEEKILCEIYAHIGKLKVGQQHKISQDILKMILLEKSKGVKFRKIIITLDDEVEKFLNGKSFIAESIRQFGIEIKRMDVPKEIRETIARAQKRQIMVNEEI